MTSKKSFLVNLRTNARRRVWLFVIMFLAFFFFETVLLAMSLSMEKMYYGFNNVGSYLGKIFATHIGLNVGMGLLVSLMAVIAAIQGFSYMYQRKKLDLYMSVPVTKGSRFAAIYVNGLLAYLVPYLANMLLCFFVAQAMGADISRAFGEAAAAVIGNTVLYLAVYHIAILTVMLTGNLIVTLMGVAVLLFYDSLAYLLIGGYMETFFDSFYYRSMDAWEKYLISPVVRFVMLVKDAFDYGASFNYYTRKIEWGGFGAGILPIVAVAAVAFALAYWCYTKKPSEACGKSMAFPKTKPVIKVCITVMTGLAAGVIFYQLSGQSYAFFIFGMLAGTLLCHGVIEVIYDFDIRSVKNGWRSLLVSAGCVAVIFLIFLVDLFQYDSYVPEADRVESVAFRFADDYNSYYNENLHSVNAEVYISNKMQITDTRPVLELAGRRMGMSRTDGADIDVRWCIVQYTLSGGRKVYRQFPTVYREDTDLLDEIVTDIEYRKGCNPIYNEALMELGSSLNICYENGWGRNETRDLSMEELAEAYRKDLEGFTFTEMMGQLVRGRIQLEYVDQGRYAQTSLAVYPSFANTIALLEREGLYREAYVDMGDVEQIIVHNSNSEMYDIYAQDTQDADYTMPTYADYSVEEIFDDPKEMQMIADGLFPQDLMDYWMPSGTLNTDYYVTVICKKGAENDGSYSFGFYMLADQIPDFVKERTAYREEIE